MSNYPYKDLGRRMIHVGQGQPAYLDTQKFKILYEEVNNSLIIDKLAQISHLQLRNINLVALPQVQ